ncbi:metalloregulator ArsR/SmtB family transcription factor [Bacteroidota bacterium]
MNTKKAFVFSEEQRETARFAKALAHPVRIAILQLLASQSVCYHGDMAQELPIAKSTLSQHLKALKEAGLIQGEIEAPATRYCIHSGNFKKAQKYFNTLLDNFTETSCS